MERSLKHMPVISKKYSRTSSPSVFVPYIISIQSDKHNFLFCGRHEFHYLRRNAVQLGRKRTLGRWFEPMTRYVFCGVALVVYVLGIFFGGIG